MERESNENGHLERWFSSNHKQIGIYLHEVCHKVINIPKFLRFEWLEEENLNNIKRLQKYKKVDKFLNLTGNLYLDLVRVFFTNLSFVDEIMCSHVKGVDMVITNDM